MRLALGRFQQRRTEIHAQIRCTMGTARESPREGAISAPEIQHRLIGAQGRDQALDARLQSLAGLREGLTVLCIEETVDFEEALGRSGVHAVIIMGALRAPVGTGRSSACEARSSKLGLRITSSSPNG